MLFWIFIAITIGGIVWLVNSGWDDEFLAGATTTIGIVAVIVSLVVMLCNYSAVDGDIAAYQERYDSLVYQYENNVYDNDNDLGKSELYKEIREWNEDVAWYKANQDSFWIGIYIPNVYDQFDRIELNQQ